MVKLSPQDQQTLIAANPDVLSPAAGAWGIQGCTYVILAHAPAALVKRALQLAWIAAAPNELLDELAPPAGTKSPAKRAPKPRRPS